MITMGLGLATRARPAAGGPRRRARPQHAAAPAAEARRDGRHLGDAGPGSRRSCSPCPTRRRESNKLEIVDPEAREPVPDARLERRGQGPEGLSRGRPPAGRRRCSSPSASWSACGRSCSRITVWSWWLAWRKRRYDEHAGSCALCTWSIPVGYVAVTAGWITTEVGRQPWVVYSHLRTADAVTPNLAGHDVVDLACACTCVVYAVVFGAGAYYLFKLVRARHRADRRTRRPSAGAAQRAPGASAVAPAESGQRTALTWRSTSFPSGPLILALARLHVRAARRLRPRRRHHVAVRRQRRRAHADHEFRRADLGRQRDVARSWAASACSPRFRSPSRSSSRRCTSRSSFMLLGLIFRGVAFEFRLKAQRSRFLLGPLVLLGLARRDVRAGRRAGLVRAGLRRQGQPVRRHGLRLVPAVPARGRRRPRVRLPAARLDLARDEDRGLGAVLGEGAGRASRWSASSPSSPWSASGRRCPIRASPRAGSPGPTSRISRRCRSPPRASSCGCGSRSTGRATRRRSSPRWGCS